jgi:molecular chaperone DnaK
MAEGNKSLGRFVLDGIAPAPRGVPQIEVTFNIDANGILNVSAKDKGTSKEQSITISGSGNLSKDDVDKMTKEAEAHAEEDKKKKDVIDAKNVLESAIYQANKLVTDNKDKVSEDDVKKINEAVEIAKKVADKAEADKEELEKAGKDLSEVIMPIGSKLYEAAKDEKPADDKAEATDETKSDEPIEGEVVDEDKPKDKK